MRSLIAAGGLTALISLSAAPPAKALDACFTQSIGPWRGPVWNGFGLQEMESDFHADADGTLVGHYHVHDSEPFDGRLTQFHQTGPCEADFTWTDRFGTGAVHIRFEPELGRFVGYWGGTEPNPTLIFDGYRVGPPIVS